MSDHRLFGQHAHRLPPLSADDDWTVRWKERHESIEAVLGDTVEPRMVCSFSWKDYILPGACALTFRTSPVDGDRLYMTLGLTHPVEPTDKSFPWEFCVRTSEPAEWPIDLLYQLVSQWLCEDGGVSFGSHFPLRFFTGHDGKLWAGASDCIQDHEAIGTIRGLHLWTDSSRIRFQTSTDQFGLLTVIGVTADEDRLADATTPAHLMLLLRRMGVSQTCDPYRASVLSLPGAKDEWRRIKHMSHDDAFDEVQSE